jgi:peptide/nickel transport system permease protein
MHETARLKPMVNEVQSEPLKPRAPLPEGVVEPPAVTSPVAPGKEWVSLSQRQLIWRRFRRSRIALIGGIVLAIFYITALFAEFFSPYAIDTRFTNQIYAPPNLPRFIDAEGNIHLQPFIYKMTQNIDRQTLEISYTPDTSTRYPIRFFVQGDPYKLWGLISSNIHFFGTGDPEVPFFLIGSDRQGRDMTTRVLFGARVSLTVGLIGVAIGLILGSILGVVSGYFGGLIDDGVQRFAELLLVIPQIPLWMALAAILPVDWSAIQVYFGVTIILSLITWGGLARQIRGKTLALREEGYVLAARAAGASHWWIIARHLLPANASHIIVIATLAIPYMILAETALSFLGLGIRAPMTSWGVLLEEAQNVKVLIFYPWLVIPAVLVILAVLGFNFVGDGLRDAVDPYSR